MIVTSPLPFRSTGPSRLLRSADVDTEANADIGRAVYPGAHRDVAQERMRRPRLVILFRLIAVALSVEYAAVAPPVLRAIP